MNVHGVPYSARNHLYVSYTLHASHASYASASTCKRRARTIWWASQWGRQRLVNQDCYYKHLSFYGLTPKDKTNNHHNYSQNLCIRPLYISSNKLTPFVSSFNFLIYFHVLNMTTCRCFCLWVRKDIPIHPWLASALLLSTYLVYNK